MQTKDYHIHVLYNTIYGTISVAKIVFSEISYKFSIQNT